MTLVHPLEPEVVQGVEARTHSWFSLGMLQQVHLINLDRSDDRLSKFKERNQHLQNVIRISAVDGTAVDRAQLAKDGLICDDLSYPPGTLGCALSHINLWQKAVHQGRVVTVFEDDVISNVHFVEEASRICNIVQNDFDIIIWGYDFQRCFQWVDFEFANAKLWFYNDRASMDYLKFQRNKFTTSIFKVAHSLGTAAYSVSPQGARALLEYSLPLRQRNIAFPGTGEVFADKGIDVTMSGAYGLMKAFICIPPLVMFDNKQKSVRLELDGR